MPEDRPQIPPPRFPVREFHSPNFADGFYTEVIKRTDPAYMAVVTPQRGVLYSQIQGANPQVIAQFPNLYFLDEQRLGNSHEFVVWIWASDPAAQDSYNAEVTYAEDQLAYPTFKRVYSVRRDTRDAKNFGGAMFSTLTSVIAVQVTNGGTGYSKATAISFGSGTAKAVPVIANGIIIAIIVTKGGGVYTTPPSVTITDTGGGTGAAATAQIQPQSAQLVRQIEQEFPDDSPWRWEFVRIVLEYRTLPGPVVTEFKEHLPSGIPIIVTNQEIGANTAGSYQLGTFQPAAINVSSITTGTNVTVTLASGHNLPPGAWVTFAGTNSTPAINGVLQILSVPAPNQMVVTPANPVTIAGTAAGTAQSKNQVQREIVRTDNGNVKMKVESIVAIPDVSVFNEDVAVEEDYPYPDYLEAFNLYLGSAQGGSASVLSLGYFSLNVSGGAAVGMPTQAGYRGPNPGSRRKRFFFVGPPPDSFEKSWTPTIIIPSQGTFQIETFSVNYSRSLNGSGPLFTVTYATSNSWRTGNTATGLTGPSPSITVVHGPSPIPISAISTGTSQTVTVSSTSGLTVGALVTLAGTDSTPPIDGTGSVASIGSSTTFVYDGFIPVTVTGAGTTGEMTPGAAVSQAFLDLPVSTPPLLVASLNIVSIGTGAAPLITLSGIHYWKPGQYVELVGTDSTPSLDDIWQIATVPSPTEITLVAPPTVTNAGTTAGTANGFITIMEQPQKLEVAGMWQCYVRLIKIRYTSGQSPA